MMAHRRTLQASDAKRRRHLTILGALTIIVLALMAVRVVRRLASASANTGDLQTIRSPGGKLPVDTDRLPPSVAVTWPCQVRRDLFAWESVFTQPSGKPALDSNEATREAAKSLHLQAIILGQHPKVIMNGRLWEAGETVDGFLIQRIENRRIVVEKNNVEIEIPL